jgi:hypothetical protein
MASMVLFATAPAAHARYSDRGFDADDRPAGTDPDIKSTKRRIVGEGRFRRLVVTVKAYERFSSNWMILVDLDAQRGPKPDHLMRLFSPTEGPPFCSIETPTKGGFTSREVIEGGVVTCAEPLRNLEVDKRIRWRLRSRTPEFERPKTFDKAPNDQSWFS